MPPDYDAYWMTLITPLRRAIEGAVKGRSQEIDVAAIRPLGNRASWSASATVQQNEVVAANQAHGRALARVVTAQRLCAAWPEHTVHLTVSKDLKLTVHSRTATGSARPMPAGSTKTALLYEDDVVAAVAEQLRSNGWTVDRVALATEHGDDIVASKGGRTMIVEAKGAGSSKPGTSRYGQAFTGNQVKTHVSVAIFRALTVTSNGESLAAVAFPDNPHHRQTAGRVAPALARAEVGIFWVSDSGSVVLEAPWPL